MAARPVLRKTHGKPSKSKSKEVRFDHSQKSPKRPFGIVRDVQKLNQNKRVSQLLQTESFVSELQGILQSQVENITKPKLRSPEKSNPSLPSIPTPPPLIIDTRMAHGTPFQGTHPLGITPINDLRGSLSSKYPPAEKLERCKLAALYRLVDMFGWSDGIYGHISCRVPQHPDQILLNPFGLLCSEITASNLVKIDLAGNIIDPGTTQYGINSAGLAIHSAIQGARPDINCVCHIHGAAIVAVSAMTCGLLPISQESSFILGNVSYHEYCGIAAQDEKEMIVRDLGDTNKILILQNHGLATLGSTVEETFQLLENTVNACKVQVAALSAGLAGLLQIPMQIIEKNTALIQAAGGGASKLTSLFGPGELEFEANMRLLDSKGYNTGYNYKGKHLMQSKSNVTVHKTPKEQKEIDQFTKERRARTEKQKAKRPSSTTSNVKKIETNVRNEEEEDEWAFVDKNKSQNARKGHTGVGTPQKERSSTDKSAKSTRRRPKVTETSGESAYQRVKRTAEKVAKSTSQAVVAQNGTVPSDQKKLKEPVSISESSTPNMTSFMRTKQTAQSVAESTTQAVDKIANSNLPSTPPPVEEDTQKNEPVNGLMPSDEFRVDSGASLGTKVRTWMEGADQDTVEDSTALSRMKSTAEQVAQSTSSAVEKLSETLHQEEHVQAGEE